MMVIYYAYCSKYKLTTKTILSRWK